MTAATSNLSPEAFPHLLFSPQALTRLEEVCTMLEALEERDAELHAAVEEELLRRLRYLNDYGGVVPGTDFHPWRVTLTWDMAPCSFGLIFEHRKAPEASYEAVMTGGLIFHGGTNDPFCVSLSPQYWGVHT
jgi:hypothetical protein